MIYLYCFKLRMTQIDRRTLLLMGVEMSGYDVTVPLYCRRRMATYTHNGQSRSLPQVLPLSNEYLVSVILQITDPIRFRRYVLFMK